MVLHTGRVRDFQTEQDPEIDTFLYRELLYQAAIQRAGASSLETLDDLFQALESLTKRRMHEGSRLTILGAGDGLEALAAITCTQRTKEALTSKSSRSPNGLLALTPFLSTIRPYRH